MTKIHHIGDLKLRKIILNGYKMWHGNPPFDEWAIAPKITFWAISRNGKMLDTALNFNTARKRAKKMLVT